MKKKISVSVLCLALVLMTSCATMFSGGKQKVTFKSNVNGTVYQNLKEIGKTNEAIKLNKCDFDKLYTIKSEGCPDKQFELTVKSNHLYLLNILNLTILGGIDASNCAGIKTDKVIEINLDCKGKK